MYFGTMPNGVSSPCGEVTRTTEPTVAPSSSDMSVPRMIGGIAATRCWTPAKSSGELDFVGLALASTLLRGGLSAAAGGTPALTADEDAGATVEVVEVSCGFVSLAEWL